MIALALALGIAGTFVNWPCDRPPPPPAVSAARFVIVNPRRRWPS